MNGQAPKNPGRSLFLLPGQARQPALSRVGRDAVPLTMPHRVEGVTRRSAVSTLPSCPGGTAETRLRIGPQPSLRDSGGQWTAACPTVETVGYCQPSLRDSGVLLSSPRDYAVRIFLREKRNPGLLSLNVRCGVWQGLNTLLRAIPQIGGSHPSAGVSPPRLQHPGTGKGRNPTRSRRAHPRKPDLLVGRRVFLCGARAKGSPRSGRVTERGNRLTE